jgi:N-acetylmuramoyl-L-alanine amidase
VAPELIVIHFTATRTVEEALDIFLHGPRQVSAHYLVDDDGTVIGLVPETERAWHAGRSWHRGRPDVNSRSIGIELRNAGRLTPAGDGERFFTCTGRIYRPRNATEEAEGHRWERFAEPQLEAVARLCAEIAGRHGITTDGLVGHSEVATPSGRKIDPGPLFPWRRLRRALPEPA